MPAEYGRREQPVLEDLLYTFFSQVGQIKGCKIICEADNESYAFVELTKHQCAVADAAAMNKGVFPQVCASRSSNRHQIFKGYYIFVLSVKKGDVEAAVSMY